MGNRAVITTKLEWDRDPNNAIGVYIQWNGGRDSVEAFLAYCRLRGFRPPETDAYGWARLCQIIGNFFGGDLSIGINRCECLDCHGDNGVYLIKDWKIVGRENFHGLEQNRYDLEDMLKAIDNTQPVGDCLGEERIHKFAIGEINDGC